jgi:hypothetical protein
MMTMRGTARRKSQAKENPSATADVSRCARSWITANIVDSCGSEPAREGVGQSSEWPFREQVRSHSFFNPFSVLRRVYEELLDGVSSHLATVEFNSKSPFADFVVANQVLTFKL